MALAARLVGSPLPLSTAAGIATVVTVTEDRANQGQPWTRLYAGRYGFPQIIRSSKRFAGPTGLEEYIGYGLGMALSVHVEADALLFRSAGFYIDIGVARLAVPRWLSPGALTVTHRACGQSRFVFELRIACPRFGELLHHAAAFEDTP